MYKFELKALVPDNSKKNMYTAYLFCEEQSMLIPISLNLSSCHKILYAKYYKDTSRDFGDSLFYLVNVLLTLGGMYLMRAEVYKHQSERFYTYLVLRNKDGEEIKINLLFSDALSLCLRSNKDFYIQSSVVKSQGVKITKSFLRLLSDDFELNN